MNDEKICPTKPKAQDIQQPSETLAQCSDLVEFGRRFTRKKPGIVALWCLGAGFVLGWKLKPR